MAMSEREWNVGVLWEGEAGGERVRVEVIGSHDSNPYPVISRQVRYATITAGWRHTDGYGDYFINWQTAGEIALRLATAEAALREAESWRDRLLAWQDAVTAEVLMHPDLPCGRDEVGIEDVPALLAIMAGRIDDPDDYDGPPHVPDEDEAALAAATPGEEKRHPYLLYGESGACERCGYEWAPETPGGGAHLCGDKEAP